MRYTLVLPVQVYTGNSVRPVLSADVEFEVEASTPEDALRRVEIMLTKKMKKSEED